jgi:hypothetical protein
MDCPGSGAPDHRESGFSRRCWLYRARAPTDTRPHVCAAPVGRAYESAFSVYLNRLARQAAIATPERVRACRRLIANSIAMGAMRSLRLAGGRFPGRAEIDAGSRPRAALCHPKFFFTTSGITHRDRKSAWSVDCEIFAEEDEPIAEADSLTFRHRLTAISKERRCFKEVSCVRVGQLAKASA